MCWYDIVYPTEANLNKQANDNKQEITLLPGREWWKPSTCIDTVNDPTGHHYLGTIGVTKSGKTCVDWDYDDHYYFFYYDDEGEEVSSRINELANYFTNADGNYCRNPTSDPKGPYCITDPNVAVDSENRTDFKLEDHIEYCDIPSCYE
jgi:hypothetical protein